MLYKICTLNNSMCMRSKIDKKTSKELALSSSEENLVAENLNLQRTESQGY